MRGQADARRQLGARAFGEILRKSPSHLGVTSSELCDYSLAAFVLESCNLDHHTDGPVEHACRNSRLNRDVYRNLVWNKVSC